jgi:hypothetical protein
MVPALTNVDEMQALAMVMVRLRRAMREAGEVPL